MPCFPTTDKKYCLSSLVTDALSRVMMITLLSILVSYFIIFYAIAYASLSNGTVL